MIIGRGELKYLEKDLLHLHLVHHKCYMVCDEIEPWALW
jgi:hypothetical protein